MLEKTLQRFNKTRKYTCYVGFFLIMLLVESSLGHFTTFFGNFFFVKFFLYNFFLVHLALNLSCILFKKDFCLIPRKTSLILSRQGTKYLKIRYFLSRNETLSHKYCEEFNIVPCMGQRYKWGAEALKV